MNWAYLLVIVLLIVIFMLSLRLLVVQHALAHQHRAPKGQFKITMGPEQFDKQVAQGALAVAITDAGGRVYMTLLVQREAKT